MTQTTMKLICLPFFALAVTLASQEPATEPIDGRIVTLRGDPVPAARIEVTTWQQPDTVLAQGVSDGDGFFRIARVPVTPGRQLRARSQGLGIETRHISSAESPQVLLAHDATTVRGVLRDKSGKPVPGAVVRSSLISRAMGDIIVDATTDDEGRFRAEGIPLGVVRFQAVVPGEGVAVATATVAGETEVEVRTAEFTTTSLRITAKGLPTEKLSGIFATVLPYASGRLSRFPPPWDKAQFDTDGTWSLSPAPDCRYIIYLGAEGYVFSPRSFTLKAGSGPHDLVFEATPAGSSSLVCHVVITDQDGDPVPGVTLAMRASNGGTRTQASSGDDGVAEFRSPLARGEEAVVYSLDERWVTDQPLGGGRAGRDARNAAWHRFTVDPDQPLAVRLIPACEISGRVALPDGRPGAFARVQLEEDGGTNRTPRWMAFSWATADRNGAFRFRGRHPMPQALRLTIEGAQGTFVGEPFALDEAGQKVTAPDVQLSPVAIIEGVVRTADQNVAPGVRVWLRDWDMATGRQRSGSVTETITDRQGRYRFRGVPTGGAWLQTVDATETHPHSRAVEPFEIEAGQTYTFDIDLPAAGG